MRRVLCGLLLVTPLVSALGQRPGTGALVGRVLDAQSGAPLAGAELVIASRDRRTVADSSGSYRFSDIAGGVYDMEVRRIGYRVQTLAVSVIAGAESESDVRLTRLVMLDTVQARATAVPYISASLRGFEDRRRIHHGGYFIAEAELRKSDNRTVANVLRRLPGIRVVTYQSRDYIIGGRTAGAGRSGLIAGAPLPRISEFDSRSPRGCWAAVFVDGVAVYWGPPARPLEVSAFQTRDLAGIEYYPSTGAVPPQFSAIRELDCGLLLLWTRER